MQDDFAAIARQLGNYFDGLYRSDAALLGRVFHPLARYVCATEPERRNIGMDEYLPIVAARPSPQSRGEARRDRIVSIDFAGPNAAIAKVNCAIGPRYFTDLLSFAKENGEWRIVAKLFHFESQPAPALAEARAGA